MTTEFAAKAAYLDFCQEYYVPIHGRGWWLDAVCGKEGWQVKLAFNKNGNVVAALPFAKSKRGYLNMIRMPILTSYLPIPIVYPAFEKTHHKIAFEKKILTDLIEQLPKVALFDQNFHPALSNWLPFYWKNFRQTTRYTYILEDLSDLSKIHRELEGNVRTYIRKAQKGDIQIVKSEDLKGFYELVEYTFQRQHRNTPFSLQVLEKLDAELTTRNQRAIYLAKDPLGNSHAAGYVVWDEKSAYYLASGTHPKFRNSGAHYLLLWTAIKDCAKFVQSFDFEGSMLPQVENVFRSFGAAQKPYFRILKTNDLMLKLLGVITGKF